MKSASRCRCTDRADGRGRGRSIGERWRNADCGQRRFCADHHQRILPSAIRRESFQISVCGDPHQSCSPGANRAGIQSSGFHNALGSRRVLQAPANRFRRGNRRMSTPAVGAAVTFVPSARVSSTSKESARTVYRRVSLSEYGDTRRGRSRTANCAQQCDCFASRCSVFL